MAKIRRRRSSLIAVPPDLGARLVAVAERAGLSPRGGEPLACAVRAASALYVGERTAIASKASDPDILAARLLFYLVRDFPKVMAPLGELWGLGMRPAGRALRVLDVGAGVGASSFGVARFAAEQGVGKVEVDALDLDGAALGVAGRLFDELCGLDGWLSPVRFRGHVGSLTQSSQVPKGPYDLVVASFVLNEVLLETPPDQRAERGAAILRELFSRVSPGGALVVLEPALKGESRTLSAVRDVLAATAGQGKGPHVVAPCLHALPCPMLAGERDWCHQELPLALPAAEARLARSAGLRFEGLSYSYLSLRHAPRVVAELPQGGRALRVVSEALVTKGKRELFGCGDGELLRLTRLDREARADNADFAELQRGDVFQLSEAEARAEGARVLPHTRVTRG